jgi:hypothetical protein
LIVVADLGALLRWVGLVDGPRPACDAVVVPDALMAEVVQFLRVKHDGRVGPILADITEVQMAVLNWYPTHTMSARLVDVAIRADADIDTTLLTPVALAMSLEIPLVATNRDVADLAAGVVSVTLLPRM